MAETDARRTAEEFPGMITKAAHLETQEVTEAELRAINKYALTPLTAEEVFTFKAVLCDNEIDRHFDQFTEKALKDLQKLFLGRTVIKDHSWKADSQVARIYATELVHTDKVKASGEPYTQLVARAYMVKTASNADLIAEIKGGIKKEGSVGFRASSAICSICGTDNAKTYCPHWAGRKYAKEGGDQVCTFTLAGASEAYEFSLVAVPAQKAAGVSKSYTGETVHAPENEPEDENHGDAQKSEEEETLLRARLMSTKTKINNTKI